MIDLQMMWNNRRLLAERMGWPRGALEECERLDSEHAGWIVYWQDVSSRHPAAYVATRIGSDVKVCASTAAAVAAAMQAAPDHAADWWQRDRCCHRR